MRHQNLISTLDFSRFNEQPNSSLIYDNSLQGQSRHHRLRRNQQRLFPQHGDVAQLLADPKVDIVSRFSPTVPAFPR